MIKFERGWPRKQLAGQAIWFGVWLFITVMGLVLTPDPAGHGTHTQVWLPACPSVALFDRPCFGCGMTTSFAATLHLDFAAAWQAHPFGTFFYLVFTVTAALAIWGWAKGLRMNTDTKAFNRAAMYLTIFFVSFGIVRFATVQYGSPEYALYEAVKKLTAGEESR